MAWKSYTSPTWENCIKWLFREEDIDCMSSRGIYLDEYESVSSESENILAVLEEGYMPPDEPWSPESIFYFKKWVEDGAPKGDPVRYEWRPTNSPKATSRYDDIFFFDFENGWAVDNNGQILKTTNGGISWEVKFRGPRGTYLRTIIFSDEHTGFAGTLRGRTPLYRTIDGGETWSAVENLPNHCIEKVCGLSHFNKVILGSGTNNPRYSTGILKSDDNGNTWEKIDLDSMADALIDSHVFDDFHYIAVGGKSKNNSNKRDDLYPVVLETRDGGNTWSNILPELPDIRMGEWGWKIQCVTDQLWFVSLESLDWGAILRTDDGGESWLRIPINDEQKNSNLEGIGFLNSDIGWVGGWGSRDFKKGSTSFTADGGNSWEDANEVGRFINRFEFFNGPRPVGYASGDLIYKLDFWEEENSLIPNIAEEIRFSLSKDKSVVLTEISIDVSEGPTLEIWDRFGDPVQNVTLSDCTAITWNGRDHNNIPCYPGDYIWRITCGENITGGLVFVDK